MYILEYAQVMVHMHSCKLQEIKKNVKNLEIVRFFSLNFLKIRYFKKPFCLWYFGDLTAWKQESATNANDNSFVGSNPMFPLKISFG